MGGDEEGDGQRDEGDGVKDKGADAPEGETDTVGDGDFNTDPVAGEEGSTFPFFPFSFHFRLSFNLFFLSSSLSGNFF